MTLGEEIKAERAKGMSLFDANHVVRQRRALAELEEAKTLSEVKTLIRSLIRNSRFTEGVSG